MPRVFLCLVFLILFFPLTGCYSQPETIVKQEEKEDPYTWDFGTVKQQELLKHDFILKNESSKTLNIQEIHTSCGCTASAAKKKQLLPGEETEIEVKFDTRKYLGQVKQFIYVNTDSLDNPVIRYIIKANVESNVTKPQTPNPSRFPKTN